MLFIITRLGSRNYQVSHRGAGVFAALGSFLFKAAIRELICFSRLLSRCSKLVGSSVVVGLTGSVYGVNLNAATVGILLFNVFKYSRLSYMLRAAITPAPTGILLTSIAF